MYDLRVEGRCNAARILGQLTCSPQTGRTQFDLSGMTFIEPIALVAIASLAESAVAAGRRVELVAPVDPHIARYLARMRLDDVLADLGVDVDLPGVRERPLPNTLLEVTAFNGTSGATALAEMVHRLVEQTDLDAANALFLGIAEAGGNVIEHSGRRGGFMAAQLTHDRSRLQFAVSDSGVGMLETLRGAGATSSASALLLSLQRGVSERPGDGAGIGLFDINEELTRLGGELHIISGNAALRSTARAPRLRVWTNGGPGTHVQGVIPVNRS
jgi:hypothetical protein